MTPEERPEWAGLEARREALLEERQRLLDSVPAMDPRLAARALRALADRIEVLEAEYSALQTPAEEADP